MTRPTQTSQTSAIQSDAVRFQTVSAALLFVCLGLHHSFAQQPAPATPFTLQAALAAAEEHNRTLIAARLGRAADLAGIDVAKQRPNPEASFEAGRDTPHEAFSIGMPLEFGGKRARRIDLATATLARTTANPGVLTQAVCPIQYRIDCPSGEKRGVRVRRPVTINRGSPPHAPTM